MKQRQSTTMWGSSGGDRGDDAGALARWLLSVADSGSFATICLAPFVFGGRHDLGRFVFVVIVAVTAIAWFLRRCLLPQARWTRTAANGMLLLGVGLLALQLVPLPTEWSSWLAPRSAELLPLWTAGDTGSTLGAWHTLSLTPHDTKLALAMLLAYGLLFVVLTQRIQNGHDVRRLLNWVAVAAVGMALFGLLQYSASNGKFFWTYEHPYRSTNSFATGSFANRNHFASFLVLGVGPLVGWLVSALGEWTAAASRRRSPPSVAAYLPIALLSAALAVVLLAILLSFSRGGIMALVTAVFVLATIYWRWRLVNTGYLYGLAGLALVMLGILSIYGYDQLAGRLDDFTAGSFDELDRNEGRRLIWAANLAAIEQGGLVGSGAGSHREINPVYLTSTSPKEYTHAENGYLQVATENGVLGAAMLLAGFGLCGSWCVAGLRRIDGQFEQLSFGAAVAGLAASVAHSFVDFVWYIPACMSVTLVLAVAVLRLAQLSLPDPRRERTRWVLARPRWLELAAVPLVAAVWMVYACFGPALASVHWDRYLRAKVAHRKLSHEAWMARVGGSAVFDDSQRQLLAETMVRHLEHALEWNPNFARGHVELAQRYIDQFELEQQDAANAMGLAQIADTVAVASFASHDELRAWLGRAFGTNAESLFRAHDHARQAVALCPLEGSAYVLLSNLCFLDGGPHPSVEAYVAQAVRVRPHDPAVVFELGRQRLIAGDVEDAVVQWAKCFADPGPHRMKIVHTLAGQFMPARVFTDCFQPDWSTLRQLWVRYSQQGQPQDLADLIDYAADVTERQVKETRGVPAEYVLLWQASMYADVGRSQDALACLERAYRANQHVYAVRYALGRALMETGRFAEAEPHFRWCLARRPENKSLNVALDKISKLRVAQRELR